MSAVQPPLSLSNTSSNCSLLAERYLMLTLGIHEALSAQDLDGVAQLITQREETLVQLEASKLSGDALMVLQKAVQADEKLNQNFTLHHAAVREELLSLFKEKRGAAVYQTAVDPSSTLVQQAS